MKFDFRKVVTTDLDGKPNTVDISKDLGNQIYCKTADLGELEIARGIYKHGEIEVKDQAEASMLSQYIHEGFMAFVQEAVCPRLDQLFNTKDKEK
jgi:hypothetical protein